MKIGARRYPIRRQVEVSRIGAIKLRWIGTGIRHTDGLMQLDPSPRPLQQSIWNVTDANEAVTKAQEDLIDIYEGQIYAAKEVRAALANVADIRRQATC